MYPKAVEAGIDADKYWSMTYEEIVVQAEANVAKRKQELEQQAMLDYKAAQLNAYALNEPKKMPKFEDHYPFANSDVETKEPNQQQDWQIMKARMIERTEIIKRTKKHQAEEGG
ncbi:hypothetical protein [Enterococcus sp. AZ103]|uniref:hypothetical protein n=1 Tax=Enterococcus sp. AZ103 TaxID=2774628 RepID=UPI003F236ED4